MLEFLKHHAAKPSLLLVDDEIDLCNALKNVFNDQFDLTVANSGKNAIEIFKTLKPKPWKIIVFS